MSQCPETAGSQEEEEEEEGVRLWYHRVKEQDSSSSSEEGEGLLEGRYSVRTHVACLIRALSRRHKTRRWVGGPRREGGSA